ncbi:SAM-dependent methyltransferase [Pseudonocardia sp. UM4_GMWB1]
MVPAPRPPAERVDRVNGLDRSAPVAADLFAAPVGIAASCSAEVVETMTLDREFWERRWTEVLDEHGDTVARMPPNAHLTAEVGDLPAGRALDAGCGHGAETMWLAARGWTVTALDFSPAVLEHARATAEEALGAEIAGRIDFIEGDLTTWAPEPGYFDLVVFLYVHSAGAVHELIQRMASGVIPGGTLFLVGHRPIDPDTGAETPAAGQVQVSVDEARAALGSEQWDIAVAEDRRRPAAKSGVDAVICARRREGAS